MPTLLDSLALSSLQRLKPRFHLSSHISRFAMPGAPLLLSRLLSPHQKWLSHLSHLIHVLPRPATCTNPSSSISALLISPLTCSALPLNSTSASHFCTNLPVLACVLVVAMSQDRAHTICWLVGARSPVHACLSTFGDSYSNMKRCYDSTFSHP